MIISISGQALECFADELDSLRKRVHTARKALKDLESLIPPDGAALYVQSLEILRKIEKSYQLRKAALLQILEEKQIADQEAQRIIEELRQRTQ